VPTVPPVFYALFSFSLYSSLLLPTKEKEKKAQNTGGMVGTKNRQTYLQWHFASVLWYLREAMAMAK
jgi:hypothetical protein